MQWVVIAHKPPHPLQWQSNGYPTRLRNSLVSRFAQPASKQAFYLPWPGRKVEAFHVDFDDLKRELDRG